VDWDGGELKKALRLKRTERHFGSSVIQIRKKEKEKVSATCMETENRKPENLVTPAQQNGEIVR
jgi:hypothetical protein